MESTPDILTKVRAASNKRRLYLPHALRQMARPGQMISAAEICAVIEHGKVIEDYPEDSRGHSCLMFGFGSNNRPIHLVCSPKDDYLAIVTAYIPGPDKWTANYSVRAKQ